MPGKSAQMLEKLVNNDQMRLKPLFQSLNCCLTFRLELKWSVWTFEKFSEKLGKRV